MLISLSSSGQATPNFWLNYQTGVNYQVAVQTPQFKMDTLQDLENTPVVAPNLPRPELLGNLATVERRESPVIVNHYDVQPSSTCLPMCKAATSAASRIRSTKLSIKQERICRA